MSFALAGKFSFEDEAVWLIIFSLVRGQRILLVLISG